MFVPKIIQKLLVTDTWASTTYTTRGRKRNQAILFCSQSLANLEDDIRKNIAVNFIFKLQSPDDLQLAAALLGYTHYARVDHIAQVVGNLQPGQAIVKTSSGERPVLINSVDARFGRIPDDELAAHMPDARFGQTNAEQEFIDNIRRHPFIPVAERRAMLGWDESRYSEVVSRLVAKGIIEKQNVRLGQGRPKVLYQLKGQVPSVRHEFYVYWIIEKLAGKGIVCRADKIGPDIQLPSLGTAINVELGSSDIYGNLRKALEAFSKVIVCSDEKRVLDGVSARVKAQNVLCALVQDVPALFELMRFDDSRTNI